VLGFRFNEAGEVLLIRKAKPPWQAGKVNGIGGKVEPGETIHQAMAREFREETTIDTTPEDWRHVLTMTGPHEHDPDPWIVDVFTSTGTVAGAKGSDDEPVFTSEVPYLPRSAMYNLRWLIPLCRDPEIREPFTVPYKKSTTEG
jgi:8-oxo-dGTP diphosphatase